MATAWLIEAGDDDLLDLGELSPVAPEKRPTATLDVSPLGEISPVDANRQRVPAARAGSKPFPFAPSPAVKGATRAATSATAAFPRSPAFAPSPLAPKRAAQREPTKNSPGTLAGAAPAPAQAPSPIFKPPLGGSRAAVAAAEPVPRRRPSAAEPPRGGGLSRHSRRQSLGLDAFQSISKGLLEEDDDFDFAPSFTPKAAKGPGAFAPSPVREEEEDVAEEEAAVEEAKAGALEEIVEEEEEAAAAEAAVEPAAEPDAPPAAPEAAEDRAPVAPEPPETAEADDAFERKLRAAMEAAERGGGLAGLSGGVQNSPPGGSTARPAAALSPVPDPALSADPRRDETEVHSEVHSDDDTVELQADVDVSMMDVETSAPTPVSGTRGGAAPRAPAAVLAALASPAEGSRTLAEEPFSMPMPASREENARETNPKPNHDEAPSKTSAPETAEADDAFERKLRAAMEAAERGGGLAGLSGGVQNSPPGIPPPDHRAAGVTEDETRASGPVPDEKEETRTAEANASRKRPVPSAKAKGKGKAPTAPDPEPETKEASVDDDAFERKLRAAMEAAERGGGLAGLSGGMQNSPPGSKPAKPIEAAAAPEISGSGDAADACGMDHDAPPTPKEPQDVLALSPVATAPASAKKRDAKPPRSGKKSKRAKTPRRAPRRDENEKAEMNDVPNTRSVEGEDEDGPSPPAADFEAMLASAIAAADGGDVDAVLGGASSKVMNSPAPARRQTRERTVRKKTRAAEAKTPALDPPLDPPRVSTRRSARVTRDSAAKTPNTNPAASARARVNTPTSRGKRRATPTPAKKPPADTESRETSARDASRVSSKPAWVSSVDPEPRAREVRASLDRSSSDGGGVSEDDVSPVPEAPAAPPPPPTAWLKKAAEAKTNRKKGWVSQAGAPAAPVVAAPVAPIAAPVVLAALAEAQSRAKASTEGVDGFDFEAKLQAALAAEAGGGEAAFGGASKVANSPAGSGEKRREFSAKEEARRQGVTVAQIMHARAHADSSPLAKVRF